MWKSMLLYYIKAIQLYITSYEKLLRYLCYTSWAKQTNKGTESATSDNESDSESDNCLKAEIVTEYDNNITLDDIL